MTDDDNLLARLTGFTPGTWELDPVKGDWMGGFYSGETSVCTFGDARDYYPTEGEPPNYANAQLIAAAPDLHRIATELAAENKRLRDALENLTIAIGMGWDLEGVVAVARAALAAKP